MRKSTLVLVGVISLLLTGCTLNPSSSKDNNTSNQSSSASADLSNVILAAKVTDAQNALIGAIPISTTKKVTQAGFWEKAKFLVGKDSSIVATADSAQGVDQSSVPIVKIPASAKRVSFLDSTHLVYLNKTDGKDHAQEFISYNLTTDKTDILYSAKDGFGIDEYVLSPDNTLAALWEVKMPISGDLSQLLGGESKITQIDLKTKQWQTILGPQKTDNSKTAEDLVQAQFNLDPSVFVQYPLFYDASNRLWLDTFGPNGGYWGNGIYTISQQDKKLTAYASLPAGSYSSDPVISKGGKYVLVEKPSAAFPANQVGVQSARDLPTNLSLTSTADDSAVEIPIAEPVLLGGQSLVSSDGNTIVYVGYKTQDDFDKKTNGTLFIYNRQSKQTMQTTIEDSEMLLGFAKGDSLLTLGKVFSNSTDPKSTSSNVNQSPPPIGEVGKKYRPIFQNYSLLDVKDPAIRQSVASNDLSEFIESSSSVSAQSPAVTASAKLAEEQKSAKNKLELSSVVFRDPEKTQARVDQQNGDNLGIKAYATKDECEKVLPGFNSAQTPEDMNRLLEQTDWFKGLSQACKTAYNNLNDQHVNDVVSFGLDTGRDPRWRWEICYGTMQSANHTLLACTATVKNPCLDSFASHVGRRDQDPLMHQTAAAVKCVDSPLYLYPTQTQQISITSDNFVSNDNPKYLPFAGWGVVAEPSGKLTTESGSYDSIAFDYSAQTRPLSNGYVVAQPQLEKALQDYATKLGLNSKESSDFVSFWKDKLKDAPYIQISHYSRLESANILKLNITPKPDTYIPIVMYFKKLSFPKSLANPIFEPIQSRNGFTAVEWSGIVE
ncbi:MAG: hypothetical protein NTZ65_02110 [Candidatus Berkelbacteria bacterium]|nr:hypothetical protein [Candidatus Berkelbacteria bacterium]